MQREQAESGRLLGPLEYHPLVQADGDQVLDGEVEEQVHPERLSGEGPQTADLLAEDRRRAELCL